MGELVVLRQYVLKAGVCLTFSRGEINFDLGDASLAQYDVKYWKDESYVRSYTRKAKSIGQMQRQTLFFESEKCSTSNYWRYRRRSVLLYLFLWQMAPTLGLGIFMVGQKFSSNLKKCDFSWRDMPPLFVLSTVWYWFGWRKYPLAHLVKHWFSLL